MQVLPEIEDCPDSVAEETSESTQREVEDRSFHPRIIDSVEAGGNPRDFVSARGISPCGPDTI